MKQETICPSVLEATATIDVVEALLLADVSALRDGTMDASFQFFNYCLVFFKFEVETLLVPKFHLLRLR
ncbi:MAG: hypothetical protein IPN88_19290 [Bacteroidetes bacterium]|nr:hypothetical protein [Bacteroidota bacterium]